MPLSKSYGISIVTGYDDLNVKEIINKADERMYEQKKRKGTNR
jgi:GGDEF domain-containing protein